MLRINPAFLCQSPVIGFLVSVGRDVQLTMKIDSDSSVARLSSQQMQQLWVVVRWTRYIFSILRQTRKNKA